MGLRLAILPPQAPWAGRLRRLAASLGWEVREDWDWRGFAQAPAGSAPRLLLVDLALAAGSRSGAVLQRLRRRASSSAIVLVVSEGLAPAAVSSGLDSGADDMVSAGLSDRALAARLRACAERASRDEVRASRTASSGGIKADQESRRAFLKGRGAAWRRIEGLGAGEFELLWLFLQHPGRVLERPALLAALRRVGARDVNPETIDKRVEALRRRLGRSGARIRTVRGRGYLLDRG